MDMHDSWVCKGSMWWPLLVSSLFILNSDSLWLLSFILSHFHARACPLGQLMSELVISSSPPAPSSGSPHYVSQTPPSLLPSFLSVFVEFPYSPFHHLPQFFFAPGKWHLLIFYLLPHSFRPPALRLRLLTRPFRVYPLVLGCMVRYKPGRNQKLSNESRERYLYPQNPPKPDE